jgi:hypothetical protein
MQSLHVECTACLYLTDLDLDHQFHKFQLHRLNAMEPSVLPADTGGVDLIDVLSVPTIGAAVLSCLRPESALRQTCTALCALVSMVSWVLAMLVGLA